jgi:hypothetical protein
MDSIKKRNYLIIACIAIMFIVFSSTDFLSFYRCNSRVNSYWTQQSDILIGNTSKSTSSVDLQASISENDLPIKIDDCKNLKVNLGKDTKVGISRFIPLFKITKFDSDFKILWSGQIKYGEEFIDISKKGEFSLNGKFRILGVCSARKTKKIILNKIQEEARRMISEDIKTEIGKIETSANTL